MSIVFYPTVAAIDETGTKVAIPIHGCVFQDNANAKLRAKTFAMLARTFKLQKDEEQRQLLQERAKAFLAVSPRGKRVALTIDKAGGENSFAAYNVIEGWKVSEQSNENGHLYDAIEVTMVELQVLGYSYATTSQGVPTWIGFVSKILPDEEQGAQAVPGGNHKESEEKKRKTKKGRNKEEAHTRPSASSSPKATRHGVNTLMANGEKDKNEERLQLAQPETTPDVNNRGDEKERQGTKVPVEREDTYFIGRAMLLEPEGVSVVSDIDDTIKLSFVTDKRLFIKNTLLREFQAVPGMMSLYKSWQEDMGARFHFVSGSPWQLYEPLMSFLEKEGFPMGSVHLRKFHVTDKQMYKNSTKSTLERREEKRRKKRMHIEPLLRQFSKRKFIFVGDSGEEDPEVYAQLARIYPDQVKAIFIRRAPDSEKHVSKIVAQTMKRMVKEEKDKEKRKKKEQKQMEKQQKLKSKNDERTARRLIASAPTVERRPVKRTLSDPSMSSAYLKQLREETDSGRWKASALKSRSCTPQKPLKKDVERRKDLMSSARRKDLGIKERSMEDRKEKKPKGIRKKSHPPENKARTIDWQIIGATTATIRKDLSTSHRQPRRLMPSTGNEEEAAPIGLEKGGEQEESSLTEKSVHNEREEEKAEHDSNSVGSQSEISSEHGENDDESNEESLKAPRVGDLSRRKSLGSPKKEVRWQPIQPEAPRLMKMGSRSAILLKAEGEIEGRNMLSRSQDADEILEYLNTARKVYRGEKKKEKEKEKEKERDKDKDRRKRWEWLEESSYGPEGEEHNGRDEDEEEPPEGYLGDEGEQRLLEELRQNRKEQEDKRWQELFGDLEGLIWRVFEDPKEIQDLPLKDLMFASVRS